jgi:hypothetical protein
VAALVAAGEPFAAAVADVAGASGTRRRDLYNAALAARAGTSARLPPRR